MKTGKTIGKRGTPLAMLAILLGAWVCLRAVTWDGPISYAAMANSENMADASGNSQEALPRRAALETIPAPHSIAYPQFRQYPQFQPVMIPGGYVHAPYPPPGYYAYPPGYTGPMPQMYGPGAGGSAGAVGPYRQFAGAYLQPMPYPPRAAAFPLAPRLDPRGQFPDQRPLPLDWRLNASRYGNAAQEQGGGRRAANEAAPAPFPAQAAYANQTTNDRWMLDVYGFSRQGSGALTIPQGRRPIYGASQLAANLQWRARPSSSHDPRVYARAYHALVNGGETELAAGVSALPLGNIPVRAYGELRATRNPAISDEGVNAQTNLRPAAYVATELLPQKLPLGLSLEAYGAGGYVGGNADTYFVDGQAAITRELIRLGKSGSPSARVSLGAGVWGGAQKDARRVDIGPTLRFDVDIGKLPARVSVDYREQVAGDAEPDSGVAATVSTRF